jgi:hypothetical protein
MKVFLLTTLFLVNYGINTAQEKSTDCQIIRVVEFPLSKKPNIKTESKIAVLNTCLTDKIPQQRPVIEVIRNGRKEFREFEVIKIFSDQAEAENHARDHGLVDVDYGKRQTTEKKQQLPNLQPFNDFYTKLAARVRSGQVDLDKDYRIRIKSDFSKGKISAWKLDSVNEQEALLPGLLDAFAQAVDESRIFQVVALKELDESIREAEIDVNLEGANANFVFRFKTDSAKSAAKIANRFKLLFSTAASIMKNQPGAEFYKNAGFEVEKERLLFSTGIKRQNLALYLQNW